MATRLPRVIAIIFLFTTLILLPSHNVDGFPNGVGDIGEQGCLCHGAENHLTTVEIVGLPEKFESNTTYYLQLIVDNPAIDVNTSSAQGGFRFVVSSGTISFNETNNSQTIGDGWTHTELGNQQRVWNLTWQSPVDNTSLTALTLYGNAVNGNGEFTGDGWNKIKIYVPGVENYNTFEQPNNNHELDSFDKVMLGLGLLALLYILVRVVKD